MKKQTKTTVRFKHTPVYRRREPSAWQFLSQRSSFWFATLSICAFVIGNMIGQHGWYAFWASVLGREEIEYAGVVSPIEKVPNYVEWAKYGGDPHLHTFKQVPNSVLVPLPLYNASNQNSHTTDSPIGQIYSVGHLGSYLTGGDGDGAHPGVDIRVPIGTPVRSIANGQVYSVGLNDSNYGNVVVVEHPNVPDPDNPSQKITLYSIYAHLSAVYVEENDIVRIGEQIALSGDTGWVTGPHLHFQIDRDTAPWHPYWPFTGSEARSSGLSYTQAINTGLHQERGLEYTVHPMEYVQANFPPTTLVASSDTTSRPAAPQRPSTRQTTAGTLRSRAEQRAQERLSTRRFAATPAPARVFTAVREPPVSVAVAEPVPVVPEPAAPAPEIVQRTDVATTADTSVFVNQVVTKIELTHDGFYTGREWESVRITLLDASGNRVLNPDLDRGLYLRTAFGSAEFKPPILTEADFTDGIATVEMLPFGRRTVVIQAQPFGDLSKPMQYK